MIRPEDVTIIIPHLGADKQQEYALQQCLESLQDWVGDPIVGKNGLTNCQHDASIEIKQQGQAGAVNAAVAITNTPWIFVTNDDMIYAPGWFEKLTKPLERTTFDLDGKPVNLSCISPKLVEPRPGAPTFITEFCGGAGGDFDKEKWLEFAKNYKRESVSYFLSGFNLPFLIKRELWDTIGGYDINYDPWGSNSDSDLEYKIKLAGVQPYQNQDCIVYHFSQTSGTFNPANDSHRFRNYAYFKEKWGFDRTDDGIWEATFDIPTKEEGRIFNPEWEGKYGKA